MILRTYLPNDGDRISEFFSKNVPYVRDRAFWIWINRMLGDDSLVAVAEKDKKIIGHYAVIPRNIYINGIKLRAGIGLHALVEPAFRNELAIYQLSNMVYNEAKKLGLDLIYGFPNTNYRLIQEKIERWIKIATFNAFECPKELFKESQFNGGKIQSVNLLDLVQLYELNTVLEEYNCHNSIRFQNTATYWLNRYYLHPQKLYEIIKIEYDSSVAYFVTKLHLKNNHTYFHIIDFAYNNPEMLEPFLMQIFMTYYQSCDIYSVWKGDNNFEQIITKLHFNPSGFDTFLGVKLLSNKAKLHKDQLANFANWRLVMGDSDAF